MKVSPADGPHPWWYGVSRARRRNPRVAPHITSEGGWDHKDTLVAVDPIISALLAMQAAPSQALDIPQKRYATITVRGRV